MRARTLAQIAGPSLLAAAAWIGFGWFPSQPSAAADRQAEAQSELEVLSAELSDARSLEAELADRAAEITTADAAVPADRSIDDFVRSANEAAVASGVVIDQFAPLAVSSDTDPESTAPLPFGTSSILISIGVTGSYPGLMDFVGGLGQTGRLVLVDSIELRSDEADPTVVVLDVELRIFTTENLVSVRDLEGGDGLDALDVPEGAPLEEDT